MAGDVLENHTVKVLTDDQVTKSSVPDAIQEVFCNATAEDTVFVYLARQGSADSSDGSFYFIPHVVDGHDLSGSVVPLADVRELFNNSDTTPYVFTSAFHSVPEKLSARHKLAVMSRAQQHPTVLAES